jgi:hypothetical protein
MHADMDTITIPYIDKIGGEIEKFTAAIQVCHCSLLIFLSEQLS